MPPLYDDEALAPLVGNSNNNSANARSKQHGRGLMINRVLVIVLAAVLVAISVYFQSQETQLSQQLASDEDKIKSLQATVDSQNMIIKRFNESVTNSDVLSRLKVLEQELNDTKVQLHNDLDQTVTDVNKKLSNTMTILDQTVSQAEAEIKEQVETVKVNFDKYVIDTEAKFSMENDFMVYQLAGTITLLSCLISMWHMTAHMQRMKQPVVQRKILAILWMSPIYAITSWFSLVFPAAEGYLAIIKDAYEAYVIYQFLSFCIAVLGKGNRATVVDLLTKRADHLTPPFRLCFCCKGDPYENPHALADAILLQCQFFALQFVFFRPLTTIANVVLHKYEYYGPWADGPNELLAPQPYIAAIQNLSIFTAFTGLLKFYHAVDKDLEWCRPFAKFLCIKGVVFMTFWQGLAITILAETTDVGGNDAEEWAKSAQNFLICLEMLLFSIAHFYCFPTYEWDEDYRANFNKQKYGIKESLALGDFISDLKLVMKGNKRKKKTSKEPSEPTVPEVDEEQPNDDEENGSETCDETNTVVSDVSESTSQTEGRRRSLAEDVANALASDDGDDNPELEDVKRRIGGFLEDIAFMPGDKTVSQQSSDADNIAPQQETAVSQDEEAPTTTGSSAEYGSGDAQEDEPAPAVIDWETGVADNNNPAPTETTSLLGGSPSPLRPSIFTTIAEMNQNDESKEKTDDT